MPKKKKKKKKNNQHKRNYLLTSKTAIHRFEIVPIQYGEQQKKMAKEFEIGISFISFTYDHSCR